MRSLHSERAESSCSTSIASAASSCPSINGFSSSYKISECIRWASLEYAPTFSSSTPSTRLAFRRNVSHSSMSVRLPRLLLFDREPPEDRSPALPPRPKGVTAPVEGSLPLPIRPRYWRGKQNENAGGRGVAWRGVAWRGVAWLKFPAASDARRSRWWVVATANHLVLLSVRRRARDPGRRRHNDSTLGCDRTPLSAPRRPTIRTTGSTTSFATVPERG
mmetsp:Transcript_37190/g.100530  ORF Transcript_37190/g.100530 Transcript_37190/m.100530 type:complete len:219 (+) Transcript_37190:782-1438(+)